MRDEVLERPHAVPVTLFLEQSYGSDERTYEELVHARCETHYRHLLTDEEEGACIPTFVTRILRPSNRAVQEMVMRFAQAIWIPGI